MYTIGKFSKLSDVPIKTLRYYDDIGLLKPSHVDYETNYRYYDYDKIDIIKKIKLLKKFGIALTDIKYIIESSNQMEWSNIIEKRISELESDKRKITNEIMEMNELKQSIQMGVPMIQGPIISGVYFENREDTLVFSIRKHIQIKRMDIHVSNLFNQVYAFNLKVNGKLIAIFHERDLNDNKADVELLIPIKDSNNISGCKILSNGKYACVSVKGPYTDLPMGYEQLKMWIKSKDLTPNGEMMEIYENGLIPDNLNLRNLKPNLDRIPSDFLTVICVPVM